MTFFKSLLSMTFFLLCFSTTHAQLAKESDNGLWGIWGAKDSSWLVRPTYKHIVKKSAFYKTSDGTGKVGLIFKDLQDSIPMHYEDIDLLPKPRFVKAKQNGKWGLLTMKKKIIIPFEYDMISRGSERGTYGSTSFYVSNGFRETAKYGLLGLDGTTILPARFESLRPEIAYGSEPSLPNLLAVKLEGKWGYAKKGGAIAIPCIYDKVSRFFDGRAVVVEEARYYLINEKGERLPKEGYTHISDFNIDTKLAVVENNRKYGAINSDGEAIIPVVYDQVMENLVYDQETMKKKKSGRSWTTNVPNRHRLAYDLLTVRKGKQYALINSKGEVVLPFKSRWVSPNYCFGLCDKEKLRSFESMKRLLNTRLRKLRVYHKNYYIITKNGKKGLMDILTEEIIIPCIYDRILHHLSTCSMNLFVVEIDRKQGLINETNEVILPMEYESIIRLNKHYEILIVEKDKKEAIFDMAGNPITDFEYDHINGRFEPFKATKGTKYGFVDRRGKEILPYIYEKGNQFLPLFDKKWQTMNPYPPCGEEYPTSELFATVKTGHREVRLMNVQGDTLGPTPQYLRRTGINVGRGEDGNPLVFTFLKGGGMVYGKDIDPEKMAIEIDKYFGFKSDGRLLYFLENHKWLRAEEIQKMYDLKRPICWVKKDGQYYFVNNLGEKVSALNFDKVGRESEGLTAVAKDGKIGFINEKVELVIPYDFDDTYNQIPSFEFKKGVSIAFKNKKYGFIDKKGKTLIPFHFEAICYFDGEMGIGSREGKWEKVEF